MSQVVLIDGKNLVFRTHYVHRTLASKDGKPISVLYGVLSSLLNLARRLPEANWAFVWDGAGKTWRHKLLEEAIPIVYKEAKDLVPEVEKVIGRVLLDGVKGSRPEKKTDWFSRQLQNSINFVGAARIVEKQKPSAPKLKVPKPYGYKANRVEDDDKLVAVNQIPELKKVLDKLGFKQFEVPGLEGDDLMGILVFIVHNFFDEVIIHSSDRDYYQFMTHGVKQLKRIEDGKLLWADQREIELEFGVPITDWLKVKALTGDSSDNIPHLFEGVGQKTAANWVQQGLDPSLKEFESHATSVQDLFSKLIVRKKECQVATRWAEVYRNYRLCKIVTSCEAKELEHCRKELRKQVEGLSVKDFYRKPSAGLYRWLSSWMVSYDMAELYGRRGEFLNIR